MKENEERKMKIMQSKTTHACEGFRGEKYRSKCGVFWHAILYSTKTGMPMVINRW